jgi:hypothetical protein
LFVAGTWSAAGFRRSQLRTLECGRSRGAFVYTPEDKTLRTQPRRHLCLHVRKRKTLLLRGFSYGRYWARTSDPSLSNWRLIARQRVRPSELNRIRRCRPLSQVHRVASAGDRCAYGARKRWSPNASIGCSSSQAPRAAFTALFSLLWLAAPRSAGLLIPRSQVRALSGPLRLAGFSCEPMHCARTVFVRAAGTRVGGDFRSLQLLAHISQFTAARAMGFCVPYVRQTRGTELGSNGVTTAAAS